MSIYTIYCLTINLGVYLNLVDNTNSINKNVLVGVITAIIIITVGFYWYFIGRDIEEKDTSVKTIEEAVEVLSQPPKVQVETNPVKNVPDLSPTEKINPFKTKNPFE